MQQRIRVGIDVGGTFTDFVLVDDARALIFTGKRLTTPDDPSRAIIEGLERLLGESETTFATLASLIHGTTLVANTLIERSGAKVGLLTTAGFRDSLEMGREIRYDLYDLFLEKPEPLVPRDLRLEIDERVDATGAVLRPFDADGCRAAAASLVDAGVEAIAVCFMHAYANPAHEQQAKAILQETYPDLPVSISSEVAPEIREYERANTAAANAYVQPLMQHYLATLQAQLGERGLRGPLYIMLSGGGITTVRAASERPIQLIESGPAAGALAAAFYGRRAGVDHLIAFDMGGTTAKMCLIENGEPSHANEFEAGRVRRFRKGSGLPLKVPVIDLIEIGAGGGSLARVDDMGLLKVGPESAGAEPGPVCYGRGGTQPAVTDADLMLGYLSPGFFLGGEMALNVAGAERAIEARLCPETGLGANAVAAGIHSIVNENMATATRMYIAEKGKDPRRYTLVATGGAGPVHAYGLAKLLKIRRIICPLGAGVTSALGLLAAAPAIAQVRSYVSRLESIDWERINALFEEMEREARAQLMEAGTPADEISLQRRADMRYTGQGFEIDAAVPDGRLGPDSVEELRALFTARYRELFDRQITGVAIEALNWRLQASAPAPDIALNFAGRTESGGSAEKGTRRVYFPETGYRDCTVYDRYALAPGLRFRGPAVIEEAESTAIAGPDTTISIHQDRNLVIEIDDAATND